MSKWFARRGILIMTGVLIVSIMSILFVRNETNAYPSVTNVRPSGYAAFFELLQRDGYVVTLERGPKPDFNDTALVIAPWFQPEWWQYSDEENFTKEELAALEEEEPEPHILEAYLRGGGSVLEIEVSNKIVSGAEYRAINGADPSNTMQITSVARDEPTSLIIYDQPFYGAWNVYENTYAGITKVGAGRLMSLPQGITFTNRYLDQLQNAEFALTLVRTLAPRGTRIAFYEAGIGNVIEPSATNTLGNWAVVARWQGVLVFVLLVVALGRRFGPPIKEKIKVRSSRELFDAVADVLRRRGDTAIALESVLQECDERISKALPSINRRTKDELHRAMPKELREQYSLIQSMIEGTVSPSTAATAANKLLKIVAAIEGDSRAARGLKR